MNRNLSPRVGSEGIGKELTDAEFSSVLIRVIESAKDDPAQLRSLIYDLARIKLKKDALIGRPYLPLPEVFRHLGALEAAIDRVEAVYSREDELYAAIQHSAAGADARELGSMQILAPDASNAAGRNFATISEPIQSIRPTRIRSAWPPVAGRALQVFGLTALGFVLYKAAMGQLDFSGSSARQSGAAAVEKAAPLAPVAAASAPIRPQPSALLPTSYGVYARNGERLTQLAPLGIGVPHERVSIGPIIERPSQALLPDGKVGFLVYRRDLVSRAPDKVQVRVVARIKRAMMFEAGKPVLRNLDGSWAIRGNSYDFKVEPMAEQQEMIAIKPHDQDFSLAPGRYALVLQGQAYDFTVEGKVRDSAHCLERIEAQNGAVYSECRTP